MKPAVLFVDDDLRVLQALVRRMRKEPFDLRTATSSEEAWKILTLSKIDLLVSDLQLPGVNGDALLAKVAARFPDCIRIMLTGNPDPKVASNAIAQGQVQRFLMKPYDADSLSALIKESLDRRDISAASGSQGPSTPFHRGLYERLCKPGANLQILNYRIDEIIGRGTRGIVLKAFDAATDQTVAIKLIAPEFADNASARSRFAEGIRYAAALRHDNIVPIFAIDCVDDLPLCVMELVAGSSLQHRLNSGDRFTIGEIVSIGRQIGAGLNAAHQRGLVHLDLKPANLLLAQDSQRLLITDFGLPRVSAGDSVNADQSHLQGTPLFMAPEQVEGTALTPATNLFNMGSILYYLCSGRHPFAAESLAKVRQATLEKSPTPVRVFNAAVPDWLARMIDKLLAKRPNERLRSASDVVDYLRVRS